MIAVHMANATPLRRRTAPTWRRRLGDVIFGVALGWMLALLGVAVVS